jgi:hypothetical protein
VPCARGPRRLQPRAPELTAARTAGGALRTRAGPRAKAQLMTQLPQLLASVPATP